MGGQLSSGAALDRLSEHNESLFQRADGNVVEPFGSRPHDALKLGATLIECAARSAGWVDLTGGGVGQRFKQRADSDRVRQMIETMSLIGSRRRLRR